MSITALFCLGVIGCGDQPATIHADDLSLPARKPRLVVETVDARLGPVGFVSADDGAVVWSSRRGGGLDLVARGASGVPRRTLVRGFERRLVSDGPARDFDVGRGPDGAPVVVWTDGCDGQDRCEVRSINVSGGKPRVIARLPPQAKGPVAIDSDRLVYVGGERCGELHVLTLPDGPDRSLGRGTCGSVRQVDIEGDHVAAAVSTNPPDGEDSFPSEAWLADVTSNVRVVQQEDAGYGGTDQITQVTLDGNALFTVRLGDIRDEIVRIPLQEHRRASAERIAGTNAQVVARDRGHTFVVDAVDEGKRSALLEYGGLPG